MKIRDFLEGRTVTYQTVQKYILRHPEAFDGHITRNGRYIDLDEAAVAILEKEYPVPVPVPVISGIDPEEYSALQNELIQSQKDNLKIMSDYIALKEDFLQLDSNRQLAMIENNRLESDLKRLQEKTDNLQAELEKTRSELDQERSQGFFQRVFRRKKD